MQPFRPPLLALTYYSPFLVLLPSQLPVRREQSQVAECHTRSWGHHVNKQSWVAEGGWGWKTTECAGYTLEAGVGGPTGAAGIGVSDDFKGVPHEGGTRLEPVCQVHIPAGRISSG